MRNLNTSDVFEFARMIKDLGLKEEIKEISVKATAALNAQAVKSAEDSAEGEAEENSNMLESIGMDMLLGLLEKLTEKKSEAAFYKFLSGPFEIAPEEVGRLDPLDLLEGLTKMADINRWKSFFKISNSIDIIHIQELLLRRYSNLTYIFNLEFVEGCELIKKAIETDIEDKVWDRWLVDYSKMDKDNFISFEDYKNKMLGSQECVEISKEALLKEAEEIERKSLEKKRGD